MTAHASETFTRPLLEDPSKQIRLLQVVRETSDLTHSDDKPWPSQDLAYSDDIRCTLTSHWLEDVLDQYTAVSYTWGPKAPTKTIYVNDQAVRVRFNCWYALWQLRRHKVRGWVWVDAICIDQESHDEKAKQVGQMGLIYSRANTVAACLGPAGGDQPLFEGRVRQPGPHMRAMIEYVCQRSYFSRAWTVQEIYLAQRVEAYCGRYRVDWRVLAEKAILAKGDVKYAFESQYLMSSGSQERERARDLSTAILRYSGRHCQEPRDKLYALLSLASDDVHGNIRVDYSQPLTEVLSSYAGAYTKLDNDLLPDMTRSIRQLAHEFDRNDTHFAKQLSPLLFSALQRHDKQSTSSLSRTAFRANSTILVHVRLAKIIDIVNLPHRLVDHPCSPCTICGQGAGESLDPNIILTSLCPDCVKPVSFRQEHMQGLLDDRMRKRPPSGSVTARLLVHDDESKYKVPTRTTTKDSIAVLDTRLEIDRELLRETADSRTNVAFRRIDDSGLCEVLGNTDSMFNPYVIRYPCDQCCEFEIQPETLLAVAMVTDSNDQFIKRLVVGSRRMRITTMEDEDRQPGDSSRFGDIWPRMARERAP